MFVILLYVGDYTTPACDENMHIRLFESESAARNFAAKYAVSHYEVRRATITLQS